MDMTQEKIWAVMRSMPRWGSGWGPGEKPRHFAVAIPPAGLQAFGKHVETADAGPYVREEAIRLAEALGQ